MHLEEVRLGYARVSMTVDERTLNGHGIAHGGLVFALADSTFALACNSYGPPTVAAHCDISFLAASHLGDELIAEAVERVRQGRSGIYDVTVRETGGRLIAEFRGHSRTLRERAGG